MPNSKPIRSFDDILYSGVEFLKRLKSRPSEFMNTDEYFLQRTYEMYAAIEEDAEKNMPTFFRQQKKTGFTTALHFIVCYYAMKYPTIMILTKMSAKNSEHMEKAINFFDKFADLGIDCNKQSNQIVLKHNGKEVSTILFRSPNSMDISNFKGCVFFNDCSEMTNYEKWADLIKNQIASRQCDRLVFNFPPGDNVDKLAASNNIKIREIKIT